MNPKGAGKKPTMDPGIRHTKRLVFHRMTAIYLTIKMNKENSDLKTNEIAKKIKSSSKKKGTVYKHPYLQRILNTKIDIKNIKEHFV